jgi:transglutaminase-like putative cysteine protease
VIFSITHTTTYSYSRAVFLEPHTVRLRPRCDGSQNLAGFELEIDPRPAGLSQHTDASGNVVAEAWFEGQTESLSVKTSSQVTTLRTHAFDYIVTDPAAEILPLTYSEPLKNSLAPYFVPPPPSDALEKFAREVAATAAHKTLPFLAALSEKIFVTFTQIVREVGEPRAPEQTLALHEGSCRDLALLYMTACRWFGIAARFVSGYEGTAPDQKSRHLHAWAEVYVPGGGWCGYDPSRGLAVLDRHVAVAAAAAPELAAPITGTFRGTDVAANLRSDIDIGCA